MRPNILYLHSHDTGRYVRPYGYAVDTPTLQALAEEGVLFRKAFCAAPTCSPSRAALLTGQYPHQTGMLGLTHRGFSMRDYGRHIVHLLRGAGYHSALAGVQHIDHSADPARPTGSRIGYDEILGGRSRTRPGEEASIEARAADFLLRPPPRPFFLSVGFVETHREFARPDPRFEDDRYLRPPEPLPDTPATRRDMAGFHASVRRLDRKYRFVLDALEKTGLAEETLVLCTTDHGIAFPRMKCNLTDAGIGVLMIMRGPGGFLGGGVVDSLVSHVDVVPTICDLLEIRIPPWAEGVSFLPCVRGEVDEVREEIFAEVTYHAAWEPQRCVRTNRWKYIRRFDDRVRPVLPNCDDGPSKDLWMQAGWDRRSPGNEALYDVIFDPNEMNDLAADPAFSEVLRAMRGRLDAWMESTGDPLLHGPVPLPDGAWANDPDGVSPSSEPGS